MRTTPWPVVAGISLALFAASAASAEGLPSTAAIGNDVLAIGVSSDSGLAQGGLGVKFTPTGMDGLPAACACGVSLSVGSTVLSESVESFTYTATTATSSVMATDPVSDTRLRMTHDFHPSPAAPNVYEVVVTVENLGSSAVQPTYARGLTWLTPTREYVLALPSMASGETQVFRLYFGAGASLVDASSGFGAHGASVVGTQAGATTFAFGYAAGETPVAGSSGSGSSASGGGSGSSGGGGGSGSSGGGGGSSAGGGPWARGGNAAGSDAGAPSGSAPSASAPAGADVSSDNRGRGDLGGPPADTRPTGNGAPTTTGGEPRDNGRAPGASGDPPSATAGDPPSVAAGDPPSATAGDPPSATAGDPPSVAGGDSLPGFQPAATPELDSLTLMASGLGGFGIYALARWRARDRKRARRR